MSRGFWIPIILANPDDLLLEIWWEQGPLVTIWLSKQLAKIYDSSLSTTHSARNFGFIFDEHLFFSNQISAHSLSAAIITFVNFDIKTAPTIATSIVHSKLYYCDSLYYNLQKTQITRLRHIQNSLARAAVNAPKFCHINPSSTPFTGWTHRIQDPVAYM